VQLQAAEKESERDRGGEVLEKSEVETARKLSSTEIMRALGRVEMLWNSMKFHSTHLVKGSNEAIRPGGSRSLG
jgi:hypothetical protein